MKFAPAVIDVADWKGVERRKGRREGGKKKGFGIGRLRDVGGTERRMEEEEEERNKLKRMRQFVSHS